jgi:tetratricopeptide (TPR) repeat protein
MNRALDLNPGSAAAHLYRGHLYADHLHDPDQALADFDEAIRLDPSPAMAWYQRGVVHQRRKEYEPAVADLTEAVKHDPQIAQCLNALAWLLATCPEAGFRDGAKAVEEATRACELTAWKNRECLDTLAAGCAEAGRFDDAVKWQKKALEDEHAPEEARKAMQQRLQLYQEGKPYREERGGAGHVD